MVKPKKLYLQLLQSTDRTVTFRDFLSLVEAFGFKKVRSQKSHCCFAHAQCSRLLVLQTKTGEAKRYQVRELMDIVEEFGLTLKD